MCIMYIKYEICGDYSEEDTPVPIPNTEVKLLSADDTWRATAWKRKTLPLIYFFEKDDKLFVIFSFCSKI